VFNTFFSKLSETLRSKEVRNKILFTLFAILIYRVLSSIPIPNINPDAFQQVFGGSAFTSIFRVVGGGNLDNASIVAIGLQPYISASIVIQMLQSVIKRWDELSKEGQRGKMILNQYTRLLTVPIAFLQAFAVFTLIKSTPAFSGLLGDLSGVQTAAILVSIVAGTLLLMWLSELITEHGVGNGPSVIIAINVFAALPALVGADVKTLLDNSQVNVLLIIMIAAIIVVGLIVFVSESVRKIPIQYASRVREGAASNVQASFFPIKLITAGVMPIIFASSMLLIPRLATQYILTNLHSGRFLFTAATFLSERFFASTSNVIWRYELTYFLLIIIFTFFYTFIAFKPSDISDNLKKSGGFIPGIRPGDATTKFITSILIRLTLIGAIFLGFIAILPSLPTILQTGITLSLFTGIGGTSILIVVSVILDTIRQINSLTVSRSYEKYR
jgi:preprotein translocase subunit SecY